MYYSIPKSCWWPERYSLPWNIWTLTILLYIIYIYIDVYLNAEIAERTNINIFFLFLLILVRLKFVCQKEYIYWTYCTLNQSSVVFFQFVFHVIDARNELNHKTVVSISIFLKIDISVLSGAHMHKYHYTSMYSHFLYSYTTWYEI